jgi:uncharacterized membrane protein YeaQ/YmgE (transglycosylase-associated protein family)
MVSDSVWLLLGALGGGIVSYRLSQREGLLLNIAIPIAGAFIIGYGLGPMLDMNAIGQNNSSLPDLVVSLLSAILLLAAVSIFRRGGSRLH